MHLAFENYTDQERRLPQSGRIVVAQFDSASIVVYQAYNRNIARYAVENRRFGGDHFSYNRMSWIKTSFLWMMYRCGWAAKPDQERVLAIWLKRDSFEKMISSAVLSHYVPEFFASREAWRQAVENSESRVQWDPDHDPSGAPMERRAVQLGLRGETLRRYGAEDILQIDDITAFVYEQRPAALGGAYDELQIPVQNAFEPAPPVPGNFP